MLPVTIFRGESLGFKQKEAVTNVRERTLVDILVDRHKDTVSCCLGRLPDRSQIQLVAMEGLGAHHGVASLGTRNPRVFRPSDHQRLYRKPQ